MTRLYAAANLIDAHILLHLLDQAGIEARVFNENAQGGVGEIPFTHAYPEVWLVHEADLPAARAIVREHEQQPVDRGTVFCRECEESSPANFQLCWHCGAALNDPD